MNADAPEPRMIAERYEVRDRIGRGAFGEVFEVYDHRLNRLVALKTLPITQGGGTEAEEDRRRFQAEARSVARLSHPGIVTVHDFGETPDFAWIAMELVIGETLKDVLDQGERPSLAETVRVVCALLDALHYAHGRGIVHRDVKPANVLLALGAEEGLGEVRLADFGIARIGEGQTVAGQLIGTPTAMSPEQVRGEEVDPRSDLWSAGVILYQMLTGQRPFSGQMPAIFNSILTAQPQPPSALVPGLPPAIDAVVAKALAKKKADRYPDAVAMAAALRAAAAPPPAWDASHDGQGDTIRLPPMALAPTPAPAPAPPAVRAGFGAWALAASFAAGLVGGALLGLAALSWAPVRQAATPLLGGLVAAAPQAAACPAPAAVPEIPAAAAPPGSPTEAQMVQLCLVPAKDPRMVRAAAEPAAEPAPFVAATPMPPAPAPEPAALPPPAPPRREAATRCEDHGLDLTSSSHAGFGRVAFDWAAPIRFSFRMTEGGAALRFPIVGCQPAVEQLALPRNVRGIHLEEDGQGLRIDALPGTRIQYSRPNRNRVVIDVFDLAESRPSAPR